MKKTKLVINSDYEPLYSWISSLPYSFEDGGKIIYNDRNQIRVFSTPDGIELNVKRYKKPFFLQQIIYSFFRKTKAERAYSNAQKLIIEGISTPTPIAFILNKKCGLLTYSYLITEQIPYKRNFYEFGKGGIESRKDILTAFACFTANLHKKNIYHKDYSPGNILFDNIDGKWRFSIVDINRMRFGKVGFKSGCRNFARLWGKNDFFSVIAQVYAQERGFNSKKCLELMLKYRNRFWKNGKKAKYEYQ